MSSTKINRRTVTINDVPTDIKDKTIQSWVRKYGSFTHFIIKRGTSYCKNGIEYQRIYIEFGQPSDVDQFIMNAPFQMNGTSMRVIRTLSKSFVLHDQCVTGLKVKIQSDFGQKPLMEGGYERHLRSYFEQFGTIHSCRWTDSKKSEAFFVYKTYDSVDKAMLHNPSPTIHDVHVLLSKARSDQDIDECHFFWPYIVHIMNLPVGITSKQLSDVLKVPIVNILLYPYYLCEQLKVKSERKSSEAWIYGFENEQQALDFAGKNNDRSIGSCRISCEAKPEDVEEKELCVNFEKGRCAHGNRCDYKHITCDEPDTCDDENCSFGHSTQRTTQSLERLPWRWEDRRYRVRFSNLPSDITREDLRNRLGLKAEHAQYLLLQTEPLNPVSPKIAYLINQQSHNKLRYLIDRWHMKPFSTQRPQLIECQLELKQTFYEWNDFPDLATTSNNTQYASPAPSIISFRSAVNKPTSSIASVSSHRSAALPSPKHPPLSTQLSRRLVDAKRKASANGPKSGSERNNHPEPSDFSQLSGRWRWTGQIVWQCDMIRDAYFWLSDNENREEHAVVKIYSSHPQNEVANIRAQREIMALTQLKKLNHFLQLVQSNYNTGGSNQSKKPLWTIMKPMMGQRLSVYVREHGCDLKNAIRISLQIIGLVKEMHRYNVIHRNIEPENILVRQTKNESTILQCMLINFDSSCINEISTENSATSVDHYGGNAFYRMPQFEAEEKTEEILTGQRSPTIDATGVCAVLFWLITGKDPKESRDINDIAPHELSEHAKTIERKIQDVTAFRQEFGVPENVREKLKHIFDHCFGGLAQQLSVNELQSNLNAVAQLLREQI